MMRIWAYMITLGVSKLVLLFLNLLILLLYIFVSLERFFGKRNIVGRVLGFKTPN